MALVKAEDIGNQIQGINSLPLFRQVGLMIAFAATVALAVAIVLWVKDPSYRMLYGNLSDQEVLEITQALDQSGIRYQVNSNNNAIMVDASRVHDARMQLATRGLPKGSGMGYELLDKDQGFGTSQFIETARYQRAIEGELSKTIGSLNNVQSARVHLAIPKQSAFVRNRKKASASVMLSLYAGREMTRGEANSIAHLVASSVPSLEMEDVTVVDQNGRLLSGADAGTDVGQSSTQFEYRKQLEQYYINRIEQIVEPIVGVGKVKAQVVADLDFTVTEQTHESYNPDLPSIRSEQTIEEKSSSPASKGGAPGTLSNQPPATGTVSGNNTAASSTESSGASNSSRRIVRNYELDKTISHTKYQTGKIKRLSAAVVVDNKDGDNGPVPISAEELARINSLVKETIGFNPARGDSVNIINAPFQRVADEQPAPETPLLDQPWIWDVAKQGGGLILVLFLVFGVLKPVLKSLAERGVASRAYAPPPQNDMALEGPANVPAFPGNRSYENTLETARNVAQQEPQRVAQVVREWVDKDGG
jgi:flagellar M-ring protein FliF